MSEQNSESLLQDQLADFFKMPMGIHWMGPDGTILKVTPYELKMLDYSPDELAGQDIADIYVDNDEVEDIVQKTKVGMELQDYKTQLRCKDGSVRHVILNSDIHREDSRLVHTRFFVRDISEQSAQ